MLDLIAPVGVSGYEQNLLDLATSLCARLFVNEDHQIHGLGDESLLRRAGGLGDKAFEPDQTTQSIVSMDRRCASGMPLFQAFNSVWASAPRTSPTTMRVGFRRIHARRHSSMVTFPTARRSR